MVVVNVQSLPSVLGASNVLHQSKVFIANFSPSEDQNSKLVLRITKCVKQQHRGHQRNSAMVSSFGISR